MWSLKLLKLSSAFLPAPYSKLIPTALKASSTALAKLEIAVLVVGISPSPSPLSKPLQKVSKSYWPDSTLGKILPNTVS
jgi:hypothetical protein